jgi:conjugative relaxase-like TrwC/TraI family protein
MFHGSKPLTVGQARTYYAREYLLGDYYTGATSESHGVWRGQGATGLGLEGSVDGERFHELLTGYSGANQLVAPETASGIHRAAWDFQVAPDKTVSLVALVGGDDRVAQAHLTAAERAFAVLETFATTRNRDRELVATGNLVAARFDHDASRSLDPQLHSHYVIFNMTRRQDGAWRALESRSLFKAQVLATAIYHAELARELQALGYDIEVYGRGFVRIAGIPEEARTHFSKRRREILVEIARQRGVKDPEKAALRTRRPKDHAIDREELRRAWVAAAQNLGLDLESLKCQATERLALGPRQPPPDPGSEARRSVAWAVDHLSERQAIFSSVQLEVTALRHATGRGPGSAEVRDAVLTHRGVVRGAAGRLTTPDALRIESGNLELMRNALSTRRPPVVPGRFEAEGLSADQLRVARHILESPQQLLAVEGKPGTGKTYTLRHVREAAERQGWTVRGFAVTTGAVEELRRVGLTAATLKHLEHQPLEGTPRQLWILDEAGLLSNRDARMLLLRSQAEGARTVLVGDRRQHHAIEAGKPFVDLQKAGLEAVRLDGIRRQKNPQILAAVQLTSAGRSRQAIDTLLRQGYVTEVPAKSKRHELMVRAFLAAPSETLMIAPSRTERAGLNELARKALVAQGRIAPQAVVLEIAVSRHLTQAERVDVRKYQVGDLVTYHRKAPTHELAAGEAARVVATDPRRHTLTVERLQGGTRIEYDPRHLRGVDVARVEHREFAPGDIVVFRKPSRSPAVANGSAARVTRIGPDGALELALAGRSERTVVLDSRTGPLPIDHGYAVTSHAAQGRTVRRVLTTIDTEHPPELVNRKQFHVTVSRATHELHIYTDDRSALPAAVDREAPKTSALELSRPEGSPARATGQSLATAHRSPESTKPASLGRRAGQPNRERASALRPGASDRGRTEPAVLARTPRADRLLDPGVQPRRRSVHAAQPPRSALRGAGRSAALGGGRDPRDVADSRRHGSQARLRGNPSNPPPPRLKERLAELYARWEVWRRERDALLAEQQALKVTLVRLRTTPRGAALPELPTALARLAVVKSRLAALTRSRNPEELLARTIRQLGVSKVLALLPRGAAAPVLALRTATRLLTSLVRDR